MRRLKSFWALVWSLYEAIFQLPSITDAVTQRTYKARKEANEWNIAHEKARYERHMALSELQALENWNLQTNILEELHDPK